MLRTTFVFATYVVLTQCTTVTDTNTTPTFNNHNINPDYTVDGVVIRNLNVFVREQARSSLYKRRRSARFDLDAIIQTHNVGADPSNKVDNFELNVQSEWIVRTRNATHAADLCDNQLVTNCTHVFQHVFDGFLVQASLREILALASEHSALIEQIEPSIITRVAATQTSAPWGLDRIDQTDLPLDQKYKHDMSGGTDVRIYVLDTGVRCSHTEFGGNRCIPGFSEYPTRGVCAADDTTCANDVNGHGTFCAGVAAGTTYGVAKNATIVAVKVVKDNGNGVLSAAIAGLDYIGTQTNLHPSRNMVVTMSFGSGISVALNDAIDQLRAMGVVVVTAAGNEATDACNRSPASAAGSFVVGATDDRDDRSVFSNYGPCVDIFAPGTSIRSASSFADTATQILTGTSAAAPHVAGAAAIVRSTMPSFGPDEIEQLLRTVATKGRLTDTIGPSPNLLLNINLDATQPPTTPAPTPAPTDFAYQLSRGCSENPNYDDVHYGNVRKATNFDLVGRAGEIQCCSHDGTTCSRKYGPTNNTCYSGVSGLETPFAPESVEDAEVVCFIFGLRLCHSQEEADLCCGKGCTHNSALVWTKEYHPTPSPAPSKGRTQHLIECGGGRRLACATHSRVSDDEEQHAVRCCSDENRNGFQQKLSECPYAASKISRQCYAKSTYDEAVNVCEGVGSRLCTSSEIRNRCARGTGCNLNTELVWVSDTEITST